MISPQSSKTPIHLRDYHEDMKPVVEGRDHLFKPEHMSMWQENLGSSKVIADSSDLGEADGKIEALQLQQSKMQYEADALALARDAAQLASLYQQEMKSDRSMRLAKVMHLKQENSIGSGLVLQHTRKYCHHVSGPLNELSDEINKARKVKKK